VEAEPVEQPGALPVGEVRRPLTVGPEHIEDDVDERDRRAAVEEPLADQREVRLAQLAVVAERNELAVEHKSVLRSSVTRDGTPAAHAASAWCNPAREVKGAW